MPFSLHLESMPDNSDRVAVMFGPLVLAGDLGEIENPKVNNTLEVINTLSQIWDTILWHYMSSKVKTLPSL